MLEFKWPMEIRIIIKEIQRNRTTEAWLVTYLSQLNSLYLSLEQDLQYLVWSTTKINIYLLNGEQSQIWNYGIESAYYLLYAIFLTLHDE